MEGDVVLPALRLDVHIFLSTPSGWRATVLRHVRRVNVTRISIHALRVEGDNCDTVCVINSAVFLSTPSGWRATAQQIRDMYDRGIFLSTPSGWRATGEDVATLMCLFNFYPRPPGGGRHCCREYGIYVSGISIHALRVEGDGKSHYRSLRLRSYFYPRPPGGGRQTAIRCAS